MPPGECRQELVGWLCSIQLSTMGTSFHPGGQRAEHTLHLASTCTNLTSIFFFFAYLNIHHLQLGQWILSKSFLHVIANFLIEEKYLGICEIVYQANLRSIISLGSIWEECSALVNEAFQLTRGLGCSLSSVLPSPSLPFPFLPFLSGTRV
jgi:hypothetical protein